MYIHCTTVTHTYIYTIQQPTLQIITKPLQLHPRVQRRLDAFAEAYGVLKNPRKVDFKPQLGTVTLELEFDNGVSAWCCGCVFI
jgi:hypothetical protein